MLNRTIVSFAFFALIVASFAVVASNAWAQPLGRTVVVPYFVGDAEDSALELAREIDVTLRARRSQVISLHDARDRFRAQSREPQSTSGSDIDALTKEAHLAMEHVAFGRTAAAEQSVRQIVELADRSLETLNRATARARTLLDACLSLVRASLHDNKRHEAIQQAMDCRRLVPDLAPSTVAHPATVIGALAEADDQLRRMRVGRLAVHVQPARACDVYVNGRLLGHTPFSLDRAPAGEYRVQVECGAQHPGRVHVVQLGDELTQLVVDSGFDESVSTEPRLAIRYGSTQRAQAALVADAIVAGRVVQAEDVLLVGILDAQPTFVRVQVQHERLVAAAALPPNALSAQIVPILELLEQGRFAGIDPEIFRKPRPSVQPAVGSSAAIPSATSTLPIPLGTAAAHRHSATATWRSWTGATALSLGVGGAAASWFLYRARTRAGDRVRRSPSSDDDLNQEWADLRAPMLGVAAAGAGVAATGIALLMSAKPNDKIPWWLAGSAAGAGVGLAVWAGVDVARGDACSGPDLRLCVDDEQRRDRGALLFTAAVPFLTLATMKIVRSSPKGDLRQLGVAVTAKGLQAMGSW